jgi:hypothetical protein
MPDFRPYEWIPVRKELFDPETAKEPRDPKPSRRMDDPDAVRQDHQPVRP